MHIGTKTSIIPRAALAGALALLSALPSFADNKLNELKKRKVELDQMAAKCSAMSEPDLSGCMAKRQFKVEKSRADLQKYKTDLAKEQQNASAKEARESPDDFSAKITGRENSI